MVRSRERTVPHADSRAHRGGHLGVGPRAIRQLRAAVHGRDLHGLDLLRTGRRRGAGVASQAAANGAVVSGARCPWVPLLFCLAAAGLTVSTLIARPIGSMVGLAFVGIRHPGLSVRYLRFLRFADSGRRDDGWRSMAELPLTPRSLTHPVINAAATPGLQPGAWR